MGYDQHQQPNSSGTLVAVIGVGLVLAVLAIIAVAGVGLFWVRASTQQAQAVAMEQRAIAEFHQAEVMALRSAVGEARAEAAADPRQNLELNIDREGNASVDGEKIDLDELRAQLAKLKEATSNVFAIHINADPECPVKHVIPVLDVCDEVGDIDYRIVTFERSDVRMTATVASYEPAAEWDHFDDGTFSAYDMLTLKVVSPERHIGTRLSIAVPPTELPEDSAFRTAGTRLLFTLQASNLKATRLSWGAIDDPTIVE